MRKKFAAFWVTLVLCLLVSVPAFAASKPALQAYVEFDINSVGGVSPTIYYRNNTGKTIKYIHWYMSAYNAVNDKVKSEIRDYSYGEETGPVAPFSATIQKSYASVAILNGKKFYVYVDRYGCPYIENGGTYYLTSSEINNLTLDRDVYFDCMWYNGTVDHIVLDKAVIIFMDGSRQTVPGSSMTTNNYGTTLQWDSFENEKKLYADVYDYTEYKNYNPDLAATLGDDEHKYIEHFISSGMKEGRRGNYEFDLAAYKANNPDLVASFGSDNAKYYEHYISSGKSEGRSAINGLSKDMKNLDRVYNYNSYRHYNPDLVEVLGDDKDKYLEHFVTTGVKEGRRGCYGFDLSAYKANNPDLVAVFGDDNQKYYEQYITTGYDEGRSALPLVPELEIMEFISNSSASGYYNLEFYYRNNTQSEIQTLELEVTGYTKSGKACATKKYSISGPIEPQTIKTDTFKTVNTNKNVPSDSPFVTYRKSGYWINSDGVKLDVYLDKYDQFFVMKSGAEVGKDNSYTYLTQDEIEHAIYSNYCKAKQAFISSSTETLHITNVKVTYADGTTAVIPASSAMSTHRKASLQNQPVMS